MTGIGRDLGEKSRLAFPSPVKSAAAAWSDLGERVGGASIGTGWAVRYRRRLVAFDAIVIALSVVVASFVEALREGFGETLASLSTTDTRTLLITIGYPVGIGLLWALCLSFQRTRDLSVVGTGADEYKRVLNATILTFVIIALIISITGHESMRSYFFVALPGGSLGLIASRFLLRRWLIRQRTLGNYLSRAIVVGSRADVTYVIDRIDEKPGALYDVVGAVVEDGDDSGSIAVGSHVVPIVAGLDDVSRAVWRMNVESVIVAGDPRHGTDYVRDLGWSLEGRATELVIASRLANIAGPRIHFRPVEGLPLMHVELPQFDGPKHVMKRATDVTLAGLALLVLLPLMAVVAGFIRLGDGGPVFFRQERVGRDGERFTMLKFRTMTVDAEDRLAEIASLSEGNGVLFKMRVDPRVTRVGRVLRKYSLDEIPQLINILGGSMSLVGPRPPLPLEVDGYAEHVHRRLYIKPGLTGMWQVGGRSDLSWEESVRLDLYYVENWSLTVDFVLMWRTVKVILRPEGAY
ncbi:Undecaprenyl-phosphate galactose phosphotransferase WbaP/exopolysaccharide biosynthesis polyprenyl glycosylphosphotransferase [Frondihabitans sp. PhB188]|uniref:sugar transferase n=1 Tax=Frondihabitans sp. PhB188 TaxID=2485200 RepID=UPI000FA3051E|nr:sugar transferase [Frondihabitans sp. PhB188]ROQ40921.1 Undecaprenyl-phosphate galactose phosphotransferase WbaP/exopolysaccharide biosynthesis polyprenyl glycosylphosphotransferase [Frondihabitans sp. PhB188]